MASDLPFLVIAELASFLESPDDLFAFMLVNKRHSGTGFNVRFCSFQLFFFFFFY